MSFSEHVAKTVFGKQSPDTQKIVLLRNGGVAPIPLKQDAKRSGTYKNHRHYALVSAVHGQAAGISHMLDANSSEFEVTNIVSSSCFDDAGMWCKDPATKKERQLGLRSEGTRVGHERKLWTRGRKIHLPVNM